MRTLSRCQRLATSEGFTWTWTRRNCPEQLTRIFRRVPQAGGPHARPSSWQLDTNQNQSCSGTVSHLLSLTDCTFCALSSTKRTSLGETPDLESSAWHVFTKSLLFSPEPQNTTARRPRGGGACTHRGESTSRRAWYKNQHHLSQLSTHEGGWAPGIDHIHHGDTRRNLHRFQQRHRLVLARAASVHRRHHIQETERRHMQ